MREEQVAALAATTADQPYTMPQHIEGRADARPGEPGVDIFEFTCVKSWHEKATELFFDVNPIRQGSGDVPGLVQFGTLAGLVCGVVSWIHPGYVLRGIGHTVLRRPIYVGSRIRIKLDLWLSDKGRTMFITIYRFRGEMEEYVTETSADIVTLDENQRLEDLKAARERRRGRGRPLGSKNKKKAGDGEDPKTT